MDRKTNARGRLAALLAAILLLAACGEPETPAAPAPVMYLIKTQGDVSVADADDAPVDPADALALYDGYRLDTGADGCAWIDPGDGAPAKLAAQSQAAIQKEGGTRTVTLYAGGLFFDRTALLAADDALCVRTAVMTADFEQACGWAECLPEHTVRVALLAGTAECRSLKGGAATGLVTRVNAGETAEFVTRPDGTVSSTVRPLYESDLPAFVTDEPLPEGILYRKGASPYGGTGEKQP